MKRDDVVTPPAAGEYGTPRQLPKSSSSATLSVTEGEKWEELAAIIQGLPDCGCTDTAFLYNCCHTNRRLKEILAALSVTEAHPKEGRPADGSLSGHWDNGGLGSASPEKEASSEPVKSISTISIEKFIEEQERNGSGEQEPPSANTHVLQNALKEALDMALDEVWFAYRPKGFGDLHCAMCKANISREDHEPDCYYHRLNGLTLLLSSQPNEEQGAPPVTQTPSMEGANKQ